MATVLLRHTDAGAPILNGTDGSLYNVLKWAAPQLGWSIAFDDEADFKLALRNDPLTGTGAYLQVTDKASLHDTDARSARVQGYLTMDGLDDGGGAWMDGAQRFWLKSLTADSAARDWVIIGDQRTIYFLPRAQQNISGANGERLFVQIAGDFDSFKQADGGAFLITPSFVHISYTGSRRVAGLPAMAQRQFNATAGSGTDESNTSMVDCAATNASGTASGQLLHCMSTPAIVTGAADTYRVGALGPGSPDIISSGINTAPIRLVEGNNLRGQLRGIFNPLHDVANAWSATQPLNGVGLPGGPASAFGVLVTNINGNTNTGRGAVVFDLGDWS